MWTNGMLRLVYLQSRTSNYLVAKFSKCLQCNRECTKKDSLLRTEMIVQEGFDVYELPIIVKRTNNLSFIIEEQNNVIDSLSNACVKCTEISNLYKLQSISNTSVANKQKLVSDSDSAAILFASDLEFLKSIEIEQIFREIENVTSADKINSLLESIIHTEINSRIALQSLKKIIELERKQRKVKKSVELINNRHLLVTQLVEFIISSKDSEMILEALSVLLKDKFNPPNSVYKDILTDEALVRSTNGEFSIQQLIDIIKIFSTFKDYRYQDAIDYFWTGLIIKQADIQAEHLIPLLKLLAYMKQSKSRVQDLLEKKLLDNYHKLSATQITEILNIFRNNLHSPVILSCVSKWANIHLTSVSKYELLEFIESLTGAKYVNCIVEKAIEKTLESKNMKSCDHALMAAVSVYCTTVQLRNASIFKKVVKYLEKHAKTLPLSSFSEMIKALGELNFKPQDKENFWVCFETTLSRKLFDIQEDEVLRILLSCANINKYFPKYINLIFSPAFLDKLHMQNNMRYIKYLRDKLYLLDTAMTIECTMYDGPLLSHSYQANPAFTDLRICRILRKINNQLVKLVGDQQKLSRHVTLSRLSNAPFYTLDALIHKKSKSKSVSELDLTNDRNKNTAIVILLPHYYCWNSSKLVGHQAMKIRHLRKLGFRVMPLDFQILCALHKQPDKLEKYLNHSFSTAHEAL